MTFNDIGNLIFGILGIGGFIVALALVSSHAAEKDRIARERARAAQIAALRAAAVKGDTSDVVV